MRRRLASHLRFSVFWKAGRDIFTAYYHSILNTKRDCPLLANWPLYTQQDWPLNELETPFSKDEVKRAVFELGHEKAPGLDGFSMAFYQTF